MNPARKLSDVLRHGDSIRTLLESAALGILAIDASGRLVLANNTVERMFGYDADELIGQSLELLIPENFRHRHLEHQKTFFANPTSRPMGIGLDLEAQRKDGSRFPIEVSLTYLDTSEGRLGVAFVSDITERKRAEQASRRSELLNRELIEHMREGFAYCKMLFENGLGSDFVYLMVNERFEILTGLKDVTGKRVTEVIPRIRELDPGLIEIYARVSMTGIAEKFEMFVEALGQWYSVSVYSPEKGFFVAIFEVIDERKRAEDALRQSEQRLVSIYNTVEDVIFHLAVEPEGQFRIVSVNAAFLRVTGLSQEKVLGKTVNEVIPEPSLTMVLGKYRQAIEENTVVHWEETSDYPVGRLTGEVSVAPVFDKTGTCTHLVGSVHDITEVKRAQEIESLLTSDLAAGRDEIRALAASLMKAQEDERRRVSRELHDHICHQLGSLAREISQLAAGPLPSKNVRAELEAIRARVVETSQETQHIAHQMHTSVLDDLGLVASMKDLCSQFSEHYPEIALDFKIRGLQVPMPKEESTCLYRVAEESLQNIAKHSRAKSVSVRLGFNKGAVLLKVRDDGAGFDVKAVKGHGGLGLISMKERAHSVNGKLTIMGRLGHGTQIALEVPLPVQQPLERPRVVLADDHPVVLEEIRSVLAPNCEIVETVADGRALVQAALRSKPDLIVVDITMPLLNGIDAAVQIKKSLPKMKLLFVTMHSSTAYLKAAFQAGGTGYVLKSGLREELPDAVRSILSGRTYISHGLSTEHRERLQDRS